MKRFTTENTARYTGANNDLGIDTLSNNSSDGKGLLRRPVLLHRRCFQKPAQGFLPWVTVKQRFRTPKELPNLRRRAGLTETEFVNSFGVPRPLDRPIPRVGNPGLRLGNTFGVGNRDVER